MSNKGQDDFNDVVGFRSIVPAGGRREPELWFQELRLLRTWSPEEKHLIRSIALHRGLNILWAEPEDPVAAAGLYNDGLAGHATGKTLFCRLLRFVLGETYYGPKELRESVEGSFIELWAVARVRVSGTAWIVGRPLTGPGSDFAVLGDSITALLPTAVPTSGYDLFQETLAEHLCGSISTLYPLDPWRHVMPWLARDQEARFASIIAWRETESEGDNPRMTVGAQHQLMRALMGLLDPGETTLRTQLDTTIEAIQRNIESTPEKQRVAERDRKRLGAELRVVVPDHGEDDLPSLETLLTSHREVREQRLQQLRKQPEPSALRLARAERDAAARALESARIAITSATEAISNQEKNQKDMLAFAERAKNKGIRDPARAHEGFCPNSIQFAQEKGCVNRPAQGMADVTELLAEAQKLTNEIATAKARKARLESTLEGLEHGAKKKENDYASHLAAHQKESLELSGDIEKLRTCERRVSDAQESVGELARLELELKGLGPRREDLRTRLTDLREAQDEHRIILSGIFADVVRAVMGKSVAAEIRLTDDGLKPFAERNGQLRGAALETIKTLAFDLAAVIASMENRGHHPRFLVHDGPREGDMARVIYERFFLYGKHMEAACGAESSVSFQYILTTTTPPPTEMQRGSRWLIDPVLDSRSKEGRLLKEDF